MLIFQTEISEEDAALREQGAFSPYTVALIVSKKKFFSRGLFENYFPESPSLNIFAGSLSGIGARKIQSHALWLFIERLAFFKQNLIFWGGNAKRRIKVIFYLDICSKKYCVNQDLINTYFFYFYSKIYTSKIYETNSIENQKKTPKFNSTCGGEKSKTAKHALCVFSN